VNHLLEQALTLDEADRATLAGALLESLEPPTEPDLELAWDAVIQRRLHEVESGAVEGIPWSKVRKQLFRGLE